MQTTAAYNFELFEPRRPGKIAQKPELEVIRNENPQDRLAPLKGICILLIVVAIVATMIYSKVVLTELSAQISTSRKELELMQNEYSMMLMELEGQTSERLIEEESLRAYGLSKMQSYQIEYMNLTEGDRIETVCAEERGFLQCLYSKAAALMEYIGGK